ncbi:glycosyltransferase family 4 protein [Providencia rettgeri]
MKNICFFLYNMDLIGGTERVCSTIANNLPPDKFTVHILSFRSDNTPQFELNKNIFVHSLSKKTNIKILTNLITPLKLRQFLINKKIDILINVESMLTIYSCPAVIGLNINNICWEHFNYKINLNRKLRDLSRKLASRYCDYIVTLTEQDKELWLANLNCKAQVITIPNPITVSPPLPNLNIEKKKLCLAIGRFTYQKGFDLLLRAWKIVVTSKPDWKLRIVGDGKEKENLKKLCVDLKLEDYVEFIPNTPQIALHYLESSFFIMSSRFEGLPLVLIEAQAYSLPIISFDCTTGPRDIIIQNETGWLCEPENINSLSENIYNAINILEKENDKYANMSKKSKLNSERFSIDKVMPLWLSVISDK